MSEVVLSLMTLAEGGVGEKFDREIGRLLSSIRDPNTSSSAQRSVSLRLVVKPDDREIGLVEVHVSSNLPAEAPVKTFLRVVREGSELRAFTTVPRKGADPRQTELPDGVTPINRNKAAEGGKKEDS